MEKNDGKIQWNRRFEPDVIALIEALAEKNQRSDANMVAVLVREAAAAQGVSLPAKRKNGAKNLS